MNSTFYEFIKMKGTLLYAGTFKRLTIPSTFNIHVIDIRYFKKKATLSFHENPNIECKKKIVKRLN